MYPNWFLIVYSVFVLWLNYFVYKHRKEATDKLKLFTIFLLMYWTGTVVFPNLIVYLSPFTPAVEGKITDAETGKPLSNIIIKAGWQTGGTSPGGGAGYDTYKTFTTKTNGNGEFHIPRFIKSPSIWVIPVLYHRFYSGITVVAYSQDYQFEIIHAPGFSKRLSVSEDGNFLAIQMKKIIDEKEYMESLLNTYWKGLSGLGPYKKLGRRYKNLSVEERKHLINVAQNFEKKFPEANSDILKKNRYFSRLSIMFEDIHDMKMADMYLRKNN